MSAGYLGVRARAAQYCAVTDVAAMERYWDEASSHPRSVATRSRGRGALQRSLWTRLVTTASAASIVIMTARAVHAQSLDDAPVAAGARDAGGVPATSSDAGVTGDASAPASAGDPSGGPRSISSASEGSARSSTAANVTVSGYVEAFWQYNFNRPYNGETAARGFDTRHNTVSLSNAVVDAAWSLRERVSGRVALQFGLTPETYYSSEPRGSGSGAPPTGLGREVWKFLQQAWVAYVAPLGRGLLLEGGIFLSPIGPEGMAIKDQWNWSRSNLFFGLPFYHTGLRATYSPSPGMNVSVAGFNGWNSVVDNNDDKSIAAQFTYALGDRLTFSALYFGGVERPFGETNGRGWRHLFDSWAQVNATSWLSFMVHANGGFEPVYAGEAMGRSDWRGLQWWAAGAAYARVRPLRWAYLALRGDFLIESISDEPVGPSGMVDVSRRPQVIFFSSDRVAATRVASATATLDLRPFDNVSIRAEYRHDNADAPIYYDDNNLSRPGVDPRLIGRRATQNTLTIGMTAWY
jgi:hypothetical protein